MGWRRWRWAGVRNNMHPACVCAVSTCMCACVHARVCVCAMHACARACVFACLGECMHLLLCTCMHVHACAHASVHTSMHLCARARPRAHTDAYVRRTCVRAGVHAYVCRTCVRACMQVYVHKYMCMHACMHVCARMHILQVAARLIEGYPESLVVADKSGRLPIPTPPTSTPARQLRLPLLYHDCEVLLSVYR